MEKFDVANSNTDENKFMLAGALGQLMRYMLTGCGLSAHRAAYLLEKLFTDTRIGEEMRSMCCHVCRQLEEIGAKGVTHG